MLTQPPHSCYSSNTKKSIADNWQVYLYIAVVLGIETIVDDDVHKSLSRVNCVVIYNFAVKNHTYLGTDGTLNYILSKCWSAVQMKLFNAVIHMWSTAYA